jgi:hypothetical protein
VRKQGSEAGQRPVRSRALLCSPTPQKRKNKNVSPHLNCLELITWKHSSSIIARALTLVLPQECCTLPHLSRAI